MIKHFNLKDINIFFKNIIPDTLSGLIFFSLLPIKNGSKDLSQIVYTIPFIGLILGSIITFPVFLISLFRDIDIINSIIIIIMSSLITGCLHEDGLADFCDSYGGNTKKRKLEIMGDSSIGAYGVISVNLSLLTRFISIYYLFSILGTIDVLFIIISVAILSRTSMLYILTTLPPAKKTGLGSAAHQKNISSTYIAFGVSALITFLTICIFIGYKIYFVSIFAAVFSTLLVSYLAWKAIKGQTGDVCGSSQQFSEIMIYLSICVVI